MCGRFTLHTPIDELLERFYLPGFDLDYSPSYNIAPTQEVLTIVSKGGERSLIPMLWGLVPPWQKEVKGRPPLINARLETLAEKPTFRRLVNSNRCLIVADGFYEWKSEDSRKYPVYFTLDQGKPFAFAGLWDDGPTPSCTIITQEASSVIKPVHHRMPLVLTPDTEELWLDSMPFAKLQGLLPDQEGRPFRFHRVSTMVNSPKNNDAACIVPLP